MNVIDFFDPDSLCVEVRNLPHEVVLQQMVDYWKERLGLQAWDIRVRHARDREFAPRNSGCTAEASPAYNVEKATIKCSLDIDRENHAVPEALCWEETIVHELLHIRFDRSIDIHWVQSHPGNEILYENGIEQTAKALVRFRRELAHERFIVKGPTAH